MNVLIGYTGFVGSTLRQQVTFDEIYNSKNISALAGRSADLVICAGITAQKWIANRDPQGDWENISSLINVLKTIKSKRFILISTVDVYADQSGGNEDTCLPLDKGQPYGLHRLKFERFIEQQFPNCLIVRLPGLFGKGLRKNVIYDLLNNNCLDQINVHSKFQWYNTEHLWSDIVTSLNAGLKLVNFVTEPVGTRIIVDRFFSDKIIGENAGAAASYNMTTSYASLFGGQNGYIQSAENVLADMERYITSERAYV